MSDHKGFLERSRPASLDGRFLLGHAVNPAAVFVDAIDLQRDDAPVRKQASEGLDGVVIGLFVPKGRRIDGAVAVIVVGVAGEGVVARGIFLELSSLLPSVEIRGGLGPTCVLVLPQS